VAADFAAGVRGHQLVRIDNTLRAGAAAAARPGARGNAGTASFTVAEETSPRAAATGAAVASTSIDALLALQAVDDATSSRKKQLRRGRSLLDVLDALKLDLLAGRTGESHLNQIMALIGQARTMSEPGLNALLDDIELRARVELAKRGLFPH
jgi:hypothetical protein